MSILFFPQSDLPVWETDMGVIAAHYFLRG